MKILKMIGTLALFACFSAQATLVNFNNYTIDSYGSAGQNFSGTLSASGDGTTLGLEGNMVKSIIENITISATTLLYFDFMNTSRGEVHGIGFDDDNVVSSSQTYKVFRNQD